MTAVPFAAFAAGWALSAAPAWIGALVGAVLAVTAAAYLVYLDRADRMSEWRRALTELAGDE